MNNYILQRALMYYFLMSEINESTEGLWDFVCGKFAISENEKEVVKRSLDAPSLNEMKSVADIYIYTTYLDELCKDNKEFGKSERERCIIEAKLAALSEAEELFERISIKGNRLKRLSLKYKGRHMGSVLYALQLMFSNSGANCKELALNILYAELEDGLNSDAGLLLMNIDGGKTGNIFASLRSLPDMALQPELLKNLRKSTGYSTKAL